MLNTKQWSTQWGGRTLTIEVGTFALQATASCTVRYGDTVVLATVVQSSDIRSGIDYFPLTVEFEEKLYAAGKIKGSRFIKREGRPTDEAIMNARMIDRAIRPLFDSSVRNDVQVVITPLSVDGENDTAVVGLIAASVVLNISSLRWEGPIAAARIGRVNNEWTLNVSDAKLDETSDVNLVVAGTEDRIIMIEAGSGEISEEDMLKAMKWGAQQFAPVIDLIKKVHSEVGEKKMSASVQADESPEAQVKKAVKDFVKKQEETLIFNSKKFGRKERKDLLDQLKSLAATYLQEKGFAPEMHDVGLESIKDVVNEIVSMRILDKQQRLDGRSLTDIRTLESAIDLLPRTHGSAMFMRGDTQVLSTVTLGAPGDVQTLDSMEEEGTKRYMHHYNDAPYTYGEAGPMRGPSRRAIGHGALAERAILPLLPPEQEFPYAIRVVSEVLGSNGSSSMASSCGSTLALMAAGVPLRKPVAGIAMGLASELEKDIKRWKVITDLQDVEDGEGGMDFKITGTRDGITGIQMDTKTKGLTWDIISQTLTQAKDARMEILDHMKQVIAEPRKELSPYAPRIETIIIDPEKIRDVIGPGGKTINDIINKTGVQIDIEQDGRVMITSNDAGGMAAAIKMVKDLTREIGVGEEFDGKVVRLEDFGAFIQLTPNKDGMVHVSEIAWERIGRPGDVLNLGDAVKVKVKEIDNLGRINLSMKVLKPKPEGYVDQPPRDRGGDDRRFGKPRRPFGRG